MSMPQAMRPRRLVVLPLLANENLLPPLGVGLKQPGRPQFGYLSAFMARG